MTIRARTTGFSFTGLALASRALALVLVVFVATPVRAQPADVASAKREQERTALYNEGLALAEAERWEEALGKFQSVVAIRSAPRALMALAVAAEKTGRLTTAKRTYGKTLAMARETGENDLVQRATSSIAALDSVLPRVVLRFPSGAMQANLTLDGVPVSAGPPGIEVDPGEHRIAVATAGQVPIEQTFAIARGQKKDIVVEVPLAAATPPTGAAPDRATHRGVRPPLPVWILGGAGVAATAIGLAIRIDAKSAYDDAARDCVGGTLCTSRDAFDSGTRARDRMLGGSILAGVGVAAMAGAGLWWFLSTDKPDQADPARDAPALSVRAQTTADGCAVRLYGTF